MFDAIGVGHVSVDYLGIIPRYPGLDERMRIRITITYFRLLDKFLLTVYNVNENHFQ